MYGEGVVKDFLKIVTSLETVQLTARITNLMLQKGDLILETCLDEFPGHPVQ
ncbi:hypothetical protein RE428_18780 [Marinobacter nanhaiticus D15-8W]|nr:hypothetical protein RE428_18780 [Marinobacter nanhaiticus D15-8W]